MSLSCPVCHISSFATEQRRVTFTIPCARDGVPKVSVMCSSRTTAMDCLVGRANTADRMHLRARLLFLQRSSDSLRNEALERIPLRGFDKDNGSSCKYAFDAQLLIQIIFLIKTSLLYISVTHEKLSDNQPVNSQIKNIKKERRNNKVKLLVIKRNF